MTTHNVVPIKPRKPLFDTGAAEATGNAHACEFFGNLAGGVPFETALASAACALAMDCEVPRGQAFADASAEINAFVSSVLEIYGIPHERGVA